MPRSYDYPAIHIGQPRTTQPQQPPNKPQTRKVKQMTTGPHNLYDELIGLIEYLEDANQWSTDEIQEWSDRCTAWIKQQIEQNKTTLQEINQ